MTLIKGNTIRGSRAGISSRGKKAIITDNNLIGSLTTDVTFLSFGIGMYTRSSGDTIISNNSITNFNTGIAYVDDSVSRAQYVNAIITNNHVSNFKKGVHIYRYPTGNYRTDFMSIIISNNVFNMLSEKESTVIYGVHLEGHTNGVRVKDNMFKGQPSVSIGVVAGYNSSNVVVIENTFYRLDRDVSISQDIVNLRLENNLSVEVNQIDGGN